MDILKIGDFLPEGEFSLHSAFNNILNLSSKGNRLISFVNDISYFSPNSFLVSNIELKEIKQVTISTNSFNINKKEFEFKKELEFSSQIVFKKPTEIFQTTLSFQNKYLSLFPKKSLAFLLDAEKEKDFTSRFDKAFVNHSKQAIQHAISGNLKECTSMMKGVGFGLTPSGDDFNAGVLFGLSLLEISRKQDFSALKKDLFELAIGKNLICNELLRQAHNSKFFFRLKSLLEAIYINQNDIDIQFKKMQEHGSSSSGDILTGFIFIIKQVHQHNK